MRTLERARSSLLTNCRRPGAALGRRSSSVTTRTPLGNRPKKGTLRPRPTLMISTS
jgi:hypothetical protein